MLRKLKATSGITMIEILSTLVLIGLIASMAVPKFESAYSNLRLRGANKDLVSTLRYARSLALADKKPYGVYFNYDDATVTIFRDSINPMAYTYDPPSDSALRVDTLPIELNYVMTDFENDVITFAPNGTAGFNGGGTGGANVDTHGYVAGHSRDFNIEIKRATGRIRMEEVSYDVDVD